jgi:predicted amidohydrolase YtcJ
MVTGLEGDSVLWEDGRIRMVGPAARLDRTAARGIPRYDLPDALVTPGLIDGHTHLGLWALSRHRVQLAGLRTRDEVLKRVAMAAVSQGWVVGQGWDANGWPQPPDRHSLDQVQDAPVYLDSIDVHAAWVNSAALEAGGISRATPDPPVAELCLCVQVLAQCRSSPGLWERCAGGLDRSP